MTGPIPHGRPIRRRVALLCGVLAAGGCAVRSAPEPLPALPPPAQPPPPRAAAPRKLPAPPVPLLSDVPAYVVLPGEVEPACKEAAVAFVTTVLTQGTPGVEDRPLERRLADLGQPLDAAASLLDLRPVGGASACEIVYPQYGGLTGRRDTASVMLVADQLVVTGRADRTVRRRSLTVDVRLRRAGDRWVVDAVHPAVTPAEDRPSTTAAALLDTDRVVLPAAARADLLAGGVHDAVSAALLELSRKWRVHVLVLTGGHPENVFGTDRTSNHTRGRAVDIWALDGVPVVDRTTCPWRDAMRAASRAGASEVGGPESLGLRGHFTDQVHQDHVHLGFGRA